MEKTSSVNWDQWTAIGTLILALVTLLTIVVTIVITKGDRNRAAEREVRSSRRDAALADRANLLSGLRQAARAYSECSTSDLADARHRAYGEWKVSIRSVQRSDAFPSLPTNDNEIEAVGVIMRTEADARFGFKDEVVDEIAQAVAKTNAMTWEEYANQRRVLS